MFFYLICKSIFFLFLLDPIGNLPMFISILNGIKKKRRIIIILREMLIALIVILGFYFFGSLFLQIVNIEKTTIEIAGSIVLFIVSLDMVFCFHNVAKKEEHNQEPFIIPLAIPFIAGPCILTNVISQSNEKHNFMLTFFSILIAWFFSTGILMCSVKFKKIISKKSLSAMQKLIGLILILFSLDMFIKAIKNL